MALQVWLRVGDSSAQDISLTSSGVIILEYPMSAPDTNQQAIQSLGDGNSLSIPTWSNVTESIDVHVSGATAADVATKVRAIETLLNLARQGTMGWLDDRLYLRVQFDHDTEPWRSQILAAKWQSDTATNQIWRKFVKGTIIITRRYYWETEAYHPIEVTSGTTTTPTTSYCVVYNADDSHGTNRNWWQVAADQVGGSISAPARIYIKNDTGASRSAGAVFIGNYVFCDPTGVDPIFRHEDRDDGLLSAGTTESIISMWELDNENLTAAFRGQFGRIVAVWNDRPASTTLMRAAMMFRFPVPEVDLALGDQILSPTLDYVLDLGSLPIPPGRTWANTGDNLYLVIKGLAASGSDSITTDWLQVFPSGQGRYRVLRSVINLSLDDGDEIVDDGPGEGLYSVGGGNAHHLYTGYFSPIYLWPNRINRLRMIISGNSSFEPDQPWQVRMDMRYRRLSF